VVGDEAAGRGADDRGEAEDGAEADDLDLVAGGLVRRKGEGGADTMFEYNRPGQRATWEARGFKLVEVYDIKLPNGWRMGRYVWSGTTP